MDRRITVGSSVRMRDLSFKPHSPSTPVPLRLRNQLYYLLRPYIAQSHRLRIRSWFASRTRAKSQDAWPILRGSEQPPPGWQGWPEGKRTAFVITHDVEGPEGLKRVKPLAELEMSLGFRSSFNFVPEGAYRVSPFLREWLTGNGFEVGVHDLHHDGNLYSSRESFARKAMIINDYLHEWGATGFRSAFMLNELEWIHDLEISYDASTFDTDPFEPQPEGRGTIFPFWVQGPRSRGYVELPYTLPQDSTLFLVLGEKTSGIWKEKFDWIATRGGMALVNVHPDYMAFGDSYDRNVEFPVARYREFIQSVKAHYSQDCWYALPREVAAYCRPFLTSHVEFPQTSRFKGSAPASIKTQS